MTRKQGGGRRVRLPQRSPTGSSRDRVAVFIESFALREEGPVARIVAKPVRCESCAATGKCNVCGGLGELASGDLCPDCLGGLCAICSGTGNEVELELDGRPTGVVELPVEWIRDDAVYFNMNRFASLRPYTPPEGVFDIFRRELEAAHREGGIFQLTMHPHISGYRSRVWILDELIRHAKGLGNVWFATHAEIAAYARAHAAT